MKKILCSIFINIKELIVGTPFPRQLDSLETIVYLDPKKKISDQTLDMNRVLRLNSSFFEITDFFFVKQGWFLAGLLICSILFLCMFLFGCYVLFNEFFTVNSGFHKFSLLWNIFSMVFMFCFTVFSGLATLVLSNLTLATALIPGTHLPIRFCRKSQRVYGFIRAGSFFNRNPRFFNAAWKDTHFYLKRGSYELYPKGSGQYEWDLMMAELNANGEIVNELYLDRVMGEEERDYYLLGQWEMIRRYMEEGAQSFPLPKVMLPIAFRRETFWEGWLVVYRSQSNVIYLIMATLGFLFPFPGFSRVLHKWIAKVPQWPDDVIMECDIDPNDTYRYEGGKNGTVIHYPTLNPIK